MPQESTHDEHPLSHKPWALWCSIFILITFGTFWYIERSHYLTTVEVSLPLSAQQSPSVSRDTTPEEPLSLTDLQAAALNTAIPDYADNF